MISARGRGGGRPEGPASHPGLPSASSSGLTPTQQVGPHQFCKTKIQAPPSRSHWGGGAALTPPPRPSSAAKTKLDREPGGRPPAEVQACSDSGGQDGAFGNQGTEMAATAESPVPSEPPGEGATGSVGTARPGQGAVQAPVPRGGWPCPSGLGGRGWLSPELHGPATCPGSPPREAPERTASARPPVTTEQTEAEGRPGPDAPRGRALWRPEAGEQKRPVVPPRSPSSRCSEPRWARAAGPPCTPRRPASRHPPAARVSLASLLPGTLRVRPSGAASPALGLTLVGD